MMIIFPAEAAPHGVVMRDGAEAARSPGAAPRLPAGFNGDGPAGLGNGHPFEDIGGLANAGAVDVLYGAVGGLQANGIRGPDDQFWFQGHDGMDDHPEAGDHVGWSLASGDFNGAGYSAPA